MYYSPASVASAAPLYQHNITAPTSARRPKVQRCHTAQCFYCVIWRWKRIDYVIEQIRNVERASPNVSLTSGRQTCSRLQWERKRDEACDEALHTKQMSYTDNTTHTSHRSRLAQLIVTVRRLWPLRSTDRAHGTRSSLIESTIFSLSVGLSNRWHAWLISVRRSDARWIEIIT